MTIRTDGSIRSLTGQYAMKVLCSPLANDVSCLFLLTMLLINVAGVFPDSCIHAPRLLLDAIIVAHVAVGARLLFVKLVWLLLTVGVPLFVFVFNAFRNTIHM